MTSDLTRSRIRSAWLFLAPMLLVLALVAAWPLARTFYFSLTDAELSRFGDYGFIGFENFLAESRGVTYGILADPLWWTAVWNANVISMFKKGTTKVPFNRIPALARVLDVDPKWLFFRAMKEYEPDLIEVIAEIYGQIITDNERRLLEVVREETEFQNPRLDADRERELRQLLHKWRMKDEVELLKRGGSVSR